MTSTTRPSDLHAGPHDRVPSPAAQRSSAGLATSFGATAAAALTAPLVLIPLACLLPPALAAAGVWTALRARRRTPTSAASAVALTFAVLTLAVTGAVALLWTFSVVNPAFAQHTELHQVLGQAIDRVL